MTEGSNHNGLKYFLIFMNQNFHKKLTEPSYVSTQLTHKEWCRLNCTKHSSVLLLRLARFSLHQSL